MTNAVIYARYSSDKQTEDSIAAQIRACTEYAAAKNITIIGQYTDEAVSGKGSKTMSRASYQRMLRDCDKGLFDTIIIHKYDRIARNLGEHVTLEYKLRAKGISLIATAQDFGDTNEAKIMRALMWSLSEYYLDNLSQEVKKGHKETALKARHNGGVAPFGYTVKDQQYVIDEFEAGYVRKIFDCAVNREGFTEILREMEACGIKGKRGKTIKYTQIYEMLRNEKYTGTYLYCPQQESGRAAQRVKPNAIRIENAFPAIIDRALFLEVQKIMNKRKQTGKKGGYLCSGLVYCSCGAKMHATASVRSGVEYAYYTCSKKCGAPNVRVEDVDEAAARYLPDLLSPENQLIIADALRKYDVGSADRAANFFGAVNAKVADKQKQYDALMSNMSSGELPAEVVADMGQRMKALKDEIAALRNAEPPKDYTVAQITAWLESLKAASDEKAVALLIERIDVKSKTDFTIQSTLKSVLGETGCGTRI